MCKSRGLTPRESEAEEGVGFAEHAFWGSRSQRRRNYDRSFSTRALGMCCLLGELLHLLSSGYIHAIP